jgi:hypothetical protein
MCLSETTHAQTRRRLKYLTNPVSGGGAGQWMAGLFSRICSTNRARGTARSILLGRALGAVKGNIRGPTFLSSCLVSGSRLQDSRYMVKREPVDESLVGFIGGT